MYFAIRDDDTSFFTKPEELESAYDFVKGVNKKISLSTVPCTVPSHRDVNFPYGKDIQYGYYSFAENKELIRFIKNGIKDEKYDVLLHGYSHEYKKIDGVWYSEMIWKTEKQLFEELSEGKKMLEDLFDNNISVFVAPTNAINKKAIHVIEQLGMDYSGIISSKFDRDVNLNYLCNYSKRWFSRIMNGVPFPGILDYGKHKELIAYTCDNYDRLVKEYKLCKKKNVPFVIYSHYWKLNEDSKDKTLLKKIYDYAIEDGAELIGLSDCFKL